MTDPKDLFDEWWASKLIAPDDERDWSKKDDELLVMAGALKEALRIETKKAFLAGFDLGRGKS